MKLEKSISTRNDVKWVAFGQFFKVTVQLITVIVLSRILSPDDFGMMALATSVTIFASLFRDMGTASAVIYKEKISDELASAVFIFNVLLGIGLCIIVASFSGLVSSVFDRPELSLVLLILSSVFFVSSLSIVHQALIEKKSEFWKIALIDAVSSVIGLGVALYIAYTGGGVYALVGQSLISTIVSSAMLWVLADWKPVLKRNISDVTQLFGYSWNVFIFGVLNYFHRNLDLLIIGKFIGVNEVGQYNIAYKVVLFPLQNITFVLNKAIFPAYSRVQHNKGLIAKHYLENLEVIAFVTAPIMAVIWCFSDLFVLILLGDNWGDVALIITWLAPVGFLQSMVSTSGSVLKSIGRTDVLRNLGLIGVPFLSLSFVVGLPWGVQGVAAAYCIANIIWVYPVINTVLKLLSSSFSAFFKKIFKTCIITLITVYVCDFIFRSFIGLVDIEDITMFLIGTSFYFFLYLSLSYVFSRSLLLVLVRALFNK